jgi:hypothetical protein
MRFPKPNTLQLHGRIGGTFVKTILVLIVVIAPLEVLARDPRIQALLSPPFLSGNPQVGVKLAILDAAVRDHGSPDCVTIGSSVADQGIDPEALGAGYQEQTGKPYFCLNGAITGLEAFGTAGFSRIYVNRYSAKTIIYIASYRDFGLTFNQFDLNMAWADYQLGKISPQGWIESNFMSYRYFLTGLWPLINANSSAVLRNAKRYTEFGQRYSTKSISINDDPGPQFAVAVRHEFGRLDPETMDMSGLNELSALKMKGIQVVVVEVPMPETAMVGLKDGRTSYDIYHKRLETITTDAGLPLISTYGLDIIPDEGWEDYIHLNATGAGEFSKWLGQQLGSMLSDS